ncbi:hypothetical protein NIES4072_30390 [Nostoc commune NIES-4072]|uniref:Uncharacterized protein n=1 Tax=Nostoc commune NIES-4072 TaxID=2005467 RepID=A0A2R5FKS6_NOSCO|nr:hypothetical protein [Nostoc commune]BBD69626.1 hypothetical protein NIES4070_60360 [Nostoc commune HK-02]GBG19372.1 hypothetical protein NIES4072_30390 [Nostoc commune NIES-4072]
MLNYIIPQCFYETNIISHKLAVYESFYRLNKDFRILSEVGNLSLGAMPTAGKAYATST